MSEIMLNCDLSDTIVDVLYFILRCLRAWLVLQLMQFLNFVTLRCSFKAKFLFIFEALVTKLVLASSLSLRYFLHPDYVKLIDLELIA